MGETWDVLYLKSNDRSQVISDLSQLASSRGYVLLPDWPRLRAHGELLFPDYFYLWLSPSIRGWIAISGYWPPHMGTAREIAATGPYLVFQCWIGREHWGYLLCLGKDVIDRLDTNPWYTLDYKYDYSGEYWDDDSPYKVLEAGILAPEEIRELFVGHPERLAEFLPLKEDANPHLLREIMDSQALFQTEIVNRFANCIDLPNFFPQLLAPENIYRGFTYSLYRTFSDSLSMQIAETIEQIERFTLLVFHPPSATQYRQWARSAPPWEVRRYLYEAIEWYRWYLKFGDPTPEECLVIKDELEQLENLRAELYLL